MRFLSWAVFIWLFVACANDPYPGFEKVSPGLYRQLVAFENDAPSPDSCTVFEVYIFSTDSLFNRHVQPKTIDDLPNWLRPNDQRLKPLLRYVEHMQPGDSALFLDEQPGQWATDSVVEVQLHWKNCYDDKHFERAYSEWLMKRELHEGDRIRKFALENGFVSSIVHPAVVFRIEESGNGEPLTYGDELSVLYTGYFLNGNVFDDMERSGVPLTFTLGSEGQVLTGLEYGLIGVRQGEQRDIVIPSPFAFGERGSGKGIVPPFTPLRYKVQVLRADSIQQ